MFYHQPVPKVFILLSISNQGPFLPTGDIKKSLLPIDSKKDRSVVIDRNTLTCDESNGNL